tara:strand:+ start:612 stop:1001 length:390 start_codon:yes stop_codon:yes gene_type:complete
MVDQIILPLLKKVLKYWQPITIVVLLVISIFSMRNIKIYKAAFEAQAENHKEDIKILNMFHQKEIDEQEKIIQKYEEKMEALIKENEEAIQELNRRKNININKNIKDFNEKPSEIVKNIEELWGFTHVQ